MSGKNWEVILERTHNRKVKGPKRPAMAEVRNLEYTCHDGELRVQFELGSGAYATTFLGQIFDLVDPDDPALAVSGGAVEEETAADAIPAA
jgi:tRNA(Glu) U13 pseudouridine synthase TruD